LGDIRTEERVMFIWILKACVGCELESCNLIYCPVTGFMNREINFSVPQKVGNFLASLATIRFSGNTLLHLIVYN
jgi:hypothetical protein